MGEFKVSHPDAYALDALCQNFLTCKRKLKDEEIKKIMNKEMIEPVVAAAVKPAAAANNNAVASHRRRSARHAAKDAAINQRVKSNDTASVNAAVKKEAGEVVKTGNHPGITKGNNELPKRENDLTKGINGGSDVAQGVKEVVGQGNDMVKGTNEGANTQHTASQGVNQTVVQGNNVAMGINGSNNAQYAANQAHNDGHNASHNQGDTTIATTNQAQYGNNGGLTSSNGFSALELQAYLLRQIQQGALVPRNCHPGLQMRYRLDPHNAHKLLHASYPDFIKNNVTLCYVRISLRSSIFPTGQYLFVLYIPRVPGIQEIKLYIKRGLEHSRQVPDCRLGKMYCILDGEENEKTADLLDSDEKVQSRFRQLAWEQQQIGPNGMQFGARLLPLVEIELEPQFPGLASNIYAHGASAGPVQNVQAQGSHMGPVNNAYHHGHH